MRWAAIALAGLALLAGCNADEQRQAPRPQVQNGLRSPEGLMIRDWLMAVQHGDFGQAATFFAPGAIIDQGHPFRLPNAAAARIFNAGLPCHAELIALQDEGAKVLATFRLTPGPGGPCRGRVQVRYTIVHGKFKEWRQLGTPNAPPAGPVV
ncbi:MAG: hypothetical protein QOD71_1263 [Thermoleophilaceae bacterium]|jgi:hypothetical protein|nr:hypothetical protein [Thermoleophilaceae bacterium]